MASNKIKIRKQKGKISLFVVYKNVSGMQMHTRSKFATTDVKLVVKLEIDSALESAGTVPLFMLKQMLERIRQKNKQVYGYANTCVMLMVNSVNV